MFVWKLLMVYVRFILIEFFIVTIGTFSFWICPSLTLNPVSWIIALFCIYFGMMSFIVAIGTIVKFIDTYEERVRILRDSINR